MCVSCGCGVPDTDHGDPANITAGDVAAAGAAAGISPQQAGANIAVALLSGQITDGTGSVELDVVKGVPGAEQRYVLGIAYQAGPDPRIAKGMDGARDYFTPAELEKAAWEFLRNGPRVGMFHVDGTDEDGGQATVVESYVYRGPDWDLGGGTVVKSGDWLVGAILNERAWELQKSGKLTGWSPQGVATRRRVALKDS